MKIIFITTSVLLIFLLTSCKEVNNEKWILSWEDNFDETDTFDSENWSKIPRGESAWNKYMSDFDSCYMIRNGNLVLKGIVNTAQKDDTAKYLTGGLWTKDKVTFENGRIEIKAKLGESTGAWPAIWMLPQGQAWPNGGEIDIMEHLNHDSIVYQTIHTNYTLHSGIKTPPNSVSTQIKNNEYNVYALELHTDSLVLFVNNQHTLTYPRIQTQEKDQFPFKGEFYLLIDMQLGGDWVGNIDPKELPVEMIIDWVKFYKKNEHYQERN